MQRFLSAQGGNCWFEYYCYWRPSVPMGKFVFMHSRKSKIQTLNARKESWAYLISKLQLAAENQQNSHFLLQCVCLFAYWLSSHFSFSINACISVWQLTCTIACEGRLFKHQIIINRLWTGLSCLSCHIEIRWVQWLSIRQQKHF